MCPWFTEEGTINLGTWQRVRERLREQYIRLKNVPVVTFILWGLVRDILDTRPEALHQPQEGEERAYKGPQDEPLPLQYSQELTGEEEQEDSNEEDDKNEDRPGPPANASPVLAAGLSTAHAGALRSAGGTSQDTLAVSLAAFP